MSRGDGGTFAPIVRLALQGKFSQAAPTAQYCNSIALRIGRVCGNSGSTGQEFVVLPYCHDPESDNAANADPVHSLFPAGVQPATYSLKGFGLRRRTLISHYICADFSDRGHKLHPAVEVIDAKCKHRVRPFLSRF